MSDPKVPHELIVILPPGTVITVNGIPAELTDESEVLVHRNNIALMFPPFTPTGRTVCSHPPSPSSHRKVGSPAPTFPSLFELLVSAFGPDADIASAPPTPTTRSESQVKQEEVTREWKEGKLIKLTPEQAEILKRASFPYEQALANLGMAAVGLVNPSKPSTTTPDRASACSSTTQPQEKPTPSPDEKGESPGTPGKLKTEFTGTSDKQLPFQRDRQLFSAIALALLSQPNPPCTKALKVVELSTPFGPFNLHHLIEQLKKNVRVDHIGGYFGGSVRTLVKNPNSCSIIDPSETPARNELMWRAAVWLVTGQMPSSSSDVTLVPQCFPALPCLALNPVRPNGTTVA